MALATAPHPYANTPGPMSPAIPAVPEERVEFVRPALTELGTIYERTAGDPIDPDGSGPLGPTCPGGTVLTPIGCILPEP
jgi:hypothetical protein